MNLRVLFTGGGTGGHIYPLVALAQELQARGHLERIAWAGRPEGLERSIVEEYGWEYHPVPAYPFQRGQAGGLIRAGLRNIKGIARATRLLHQHSVDVVIGSGGYVAVPVYAAARLHGVPYFIIESNAVLGVANRWFADHARALFAAFPLRGRQPRTEVLVTGNPVRHEFCSPGRAPVPDEWRGKTLLVVVGGSQGAEVLNTFMAEQAERLLAQHPELRIMHIAGVRGALELAQRLAHLPQIKVLPFTRELPALFTAAALVLARAGAMTLSELAYCGVPAVLLPFPHAAEDHQFANASSFAADGRALVVRHDPKDEPGTRARLAETLEAALTGTMLVAMRTAAQRNKGSNPASAIVDTLEKLIGRKSA